MIIIYHDSNTNSRVESVVEQKPPFGTAKFSVFCLIYSNIVGYSRPTVYIIQDSDAVNYAALVFCS